MEIVVKASFGRKPGAACGETFLPVMPRLIITSGEVPSGETAGSHAKD